MRTRTTITPRPRPAPTPRRVLSSQTETFSTLSAKTTALAPARNTPFQPCSTIGRSSVSISTPASCSRTSMAASRTDFWRPKTSPRPPACASSSELSFTEEEGRLRPLSLRPRSPVVDAAPPHAIVGIAAQAVGPMDVVGLVLIGVRASEHCRQLVRGELQCGPQRHDRNALILCAHRNGSRQRTRQYSRNRQPAQGRYPHSCLLFASAGRYTHPRHRKPSHDVAQGI